MRNIIAIAVFALVLQLVVACTKNVGVTHATEPENPNYIVKRMPNIEIHSVTRLVDCEALTVSYVRYEAISTVSLNSGQISKLCPNS